MNIAIKNLTRRFGKAVALREVSLEIHPGEIVAVVGANGAGKTTLLRCLAGILAPNEGDILYDDNLFRRDRVDLRRRFSYLPDFPELFRDRTLLDHVGMVVRIYEAERPGLEAEILQLLRDFDLLPLVDAPLHTLSRGQQYKTALAAVLAIDPELWMFDEPFASGMDPRGISQFRRHAREAVERDRTVVYTTQIIELAAQFSTRICVIQQGRMEAFEPIGEMRRRAAENPQLRELLDTLDPDAGDSEL